MAPPAMWSAAVRSMVVGAMRTPFNSAGCGRRARRCLSRDRRCSSAYDKAHAEVCHGADFEQLQADGIDLRLCPLGVLQTQPAQGLDQRVGQRREVEPQLVALHFIGGEPVGEQAPLFSR